MIYDICGGDDADYLEAGWDLSKTNKAKELFVVITDSCDKTKVIGLIESWGVTVNSSWEAKMAQDNIDEKMPFTSILQTGGLGQVVDSELVEAFKGRTHFTKAQTRQIWTAIAPLSFTLEVSFVAIQSPVNEVIGAIQLLQRMASPVIKEDLIDSYKTVLQETINGIRSGTVPDAGTLNTILGYIPNELTVDLFDKYYSNVKYILTDVSFTDADMLLHHESRTSIKQNVSLSFTSTTSVNKEDIEQIGGRLPQ